MPYKKIMDLPEGLADGWALDEKRPCFHPEHNPPGHVVLPPGVYEYECPACGKKQIVRVPAVYSTGYGSPTRYAVLDPKRIVNEPEPG